MKAVRSLCAWLGALGPLFALAQCCGQGTLTRITFDGPPPQPRGTQHRVHQYYESEISFTPVDPSVPGAAFLRNGGGITGYPDDGTAYLQAGFGDSLAISSTTGGLFDLVSVDLAEYSDVVRDPTSVHFVGYRQDGTVVTEDITTAGIFNGLAPVFTNFTFGPRFSGLVRVEIPYPLWSLDNLTLWRNVPEPGTGGLLGLGAALLGVRSLRRKR